MPWFPDLEAARQLYPRHPANPVERLLYYDGIRMRDAATLAASFAGEPDVDDPRLGHVRGVDAFTSYVTAVHHWLDAEVTATDSVSRTHTKERSVEEVRLRLANGDSIGAAIAADLAGDGKMQRIRIYYARSGAGFATDREAHI
jgi:hypothetical protein